MSRTSQIARLILESDDVRRGTKDAQLGVEVCLDQLLEEIGELVFAAAMKGATPSQIRETVLSQLSHQELRFTPNPRPHP